MGLSLTLQAWLFFPRKGFFFATARRKWHDKEVGAKAGEYDSARTVQAVGRQRLMSPNL
jgi:hypothetical protein